MVEASIGPAGIKLRIEATLIREGIRGLGAIVRDSLSGYVFVEFWATNGNQYAGQWRRPSARSSWQIIDDSRNYKSMRYATVDPRSLPSGGLDVTVLESNETPTQPTNLRFVPQQITDFVVYYLP